MHLQCQRSCWIMSDHTSSFEVFSWGKVSFFLFASLSVGKLITSFVEFLNCITVGLIKKGLLFSEKYLFVTGFCLIWKFSEYPVDHRLNAAIIPHFSINSYNWSYSKFSLKKLQLILVLKYLWQNLFKINGKETKQKQIQLSQNLKTFNMNLF